MFTGCLIACDGVDKLASSGKFIVFGTYNQIITRDPVHIHNFTFYLRMVTMITGDLACRIKIYDRIAGNDRPPLMDMPLAFNLQKNTVADFEQLFETAFVVPQVRLSVGEEDIKAAKNYINPFDFVLSTNGYEIARTTMSVAFLLAKPQ